MMAVDPSPRICYNSKGHWKCEHFLRFSNVIRHDEHDAGPDERELDDEWIQVWSRSRNCFAQNVQTKLVANFIVRFRSFDPVQKYVATVVAALMIDEVNLKVYKTNFFLLNKKFFVASGRYYQL